MKKLMIAAAAALAAGGVYAGGCGDDTTVDPDPVNQVYKLSFNGKTTIGTPKASVVTEGYCGDETTTEGCVVRIPGTIKIEGWVLLCDISCTGIKEAFSAPRKAAFWASKPYFGDIPDGKVTLDVLNVIGKSGADAEAYGVFTGTIGFAGGTKEWDLTGDGLAFAGFGKYTPKTQSFNNFKGKFTGKPPASWYIKGSVCEQTHPWDCATMTVDCGNTENTVAFGEWTMKYDAAASKKAETSTPKTPKGVTIQAS